METSNLFNHTCNINEMATRLVKLSTPEQVAAQLHDMQLELNAQWMAEGRILKPSVEHLDDAVEMIELAGLQEEKMSELVEIMQRHDPGSEAWSQLMDELRQMIGAHLRTEKRVMNLLMVHTTRSERELIQRNVELEKMTIIARHRTMEAGS